MNVMCGTKFGIARNRSKCCLCCTCTNAVFSVVKLLMFKSKQSIVFYFKMLLFANLMKLVSLIET